MRFDTMRNAARRVWNSARVCSRDGRRERGQTLLEFAFAAPLLLVFLLAIVDFGIAIDRRIVLDHAVREGARFAAVGGDAFVTGVPASAEEIEQYTERQSQGIADAAGATGSDNYIDVCYADANGNGFGDVGEEVRVDVRYKHPFVTGFTSFFNLGLAPIVMEPSASARIEQPLPGDVPSTMETTGC